MVRLATALLMLVLASAGAQAAMRGTLVLRGGAIYTLDPARPWAQALVVRDGRIVYVGNEAGTRAFDGRDARTIALRGRMVLPGFHDGHSHPMSGAMRLLQCRFDGLVSARAIYDAVRRCAQASPAGAWVLGNGWAETAFGPGGPRRAALDDIVPDRPAMLRTEDGYTAWVNSTALALAGIDPEGSTPLAEGLARDPASGKPTGILRNDAIALVRRHVPPPTEGEYREALRRATAIANRFGITSIFDASASAAMLDAYHAADLAGELTVRIVAAQLVDPRRGTDQVDDFVARRVRFRGPLLRADAAKIFLDGEIGMHSAAMLAPYADMPDSRGDLFIRAGALDAIVRRLDAEGFSIHMHAMGDGAVRAGLDAIEQAMAANGPRDRRHQLAHIGIADLSDISRFGRLGVTANIQPLWFQAGDPATASTDAALGPARTRRNYPVASIAQAGGRIVASSDWPGPTMNPLDGIQYAITTQTLDGVLTARQPEQRIGLAAALAAYTRDAAWVAREDALDGGLAPGKAADLVVLDRNLFRLRARDLHKARVLLTLLAGEPVYRDPGFPWPG
ncbi:MAG TPA: amidohydrolase [Rhizomicrobium sp.]